MPEPASNPLSTPCSRRRLLRGAAALAGGVALKVTAAAWAVAPPKESGLSFEGLLKREPGFQPRRPAPLAYDSLPGLLSAQQIARVDAAYLGAFAELLEAERRLASAPRDAAHAAQYGALRRNQMRAANWVGANPLVVAAVADEAWSPEYPHRDAWVAAFVEHIDWKVVAARYRAVDRQ